MTTSGSSEYDLLDQLAEEFAERYRRGERPSLQEYIAQYPQLAEGIRDLFPAMVEVEQVEQDRRDPAAPPAAASTALPLQQIGDYRILREIGRGGMGIVYEAEQISLGRHVALKVLPAHTLLDPKRLHRFRREAQAAARLHHSNIVPVFGVGEQDSLHYYVMQFIQGLPLDEVLTEMQRLRRLKASPVTEEGQASAPQPSARRSDISVEAVAQALLSGPYTASGQPPSEVRGQKSEVRSQRSQEADPPRVPVAEARIHLPGQADDSTLSESGREYWHSVARIGIQVAEALAYANSQGILHRDIKPSNLLLDTQGTVWITDFGLAKAADSADLTDTGDLVGTFRYMAPERFEGQADVRSDLYSLGLTLYELLTLQPAFQAADRNQLMAQVRHEEPPRPRKLNPEVPGALETIVQKAIAKEPAHRYQTATELAADLKRFVEDRPIRARRVSTAERLGRWCRRNPLVASLTAAVAVLFLAVTVGSLLAAGHIAGVNVDLTKARDEATHNATEANRLAAEERAARQQEAEARQEANVQRQNALKAAEAERQAGLHADQRRREAEAAKDQLRRQLYLSDLNLAPQLHDDGNIRRLLELLDNHRPRLGEQDLRGFEWYSWWRAANLPVARMVGGDVRWPILHMTVSPDGKTVAASRSDGSVLICDSRAKTVVRRLPGNALGSAGGVLAFARDGSVLALAGPGRQISRWDTRTWNQLPTLTEHAEGQQVWAVAFSSNAPVMGSADGAGNVVLWNAETWKPIDRYHASSAVSSLAFAPDGQTLVAGTAVGGLVRASGWSTQPPAVRWEFAAALKPASRAWNTAVINSIAYSPDGSLIATGSHDRMIRLWQARSFDVTQTLEAIGAVSSLAFSPDGKYLAAGTWRGNAVQVWNLESRKLLATIRGHELVVMAVLFVDGATTLWSAAADGQLLVWDLARCQPFDTFALEVGFRSQVAYAEDGRVLICRAEDGTLKRWDVERRTPLAPWKEGEKFFACALSADGQTLAALTADGKLHVWEVGSGKLRGTWPVEGKVGDELNPGLQPLALSRDGTMVAWTLQDGPSGPGVVVLDVAAGKQTLLPAQRKAAPSSLTFLPDGKQLASLESGRFQLWDLTGAQPVRGPLLGTGLHWNAVFSPDGALLAVGSPNNEAYLYDTRTGELRHTLRGHAGGVICLAFARDGASLVSGSLDGTVRVWDPTRGEMRSTFTGHGEAVTAVAVSPDGLSIASSSIDQSVRIWRRATSEEVQRGSSDYGRRMYARGMERVRSGQWQPAAADLSQAVAYLPPRTREWHEAAYRLAFVLVYLGDTEAYQALCRQHLRDFQDTQDVQFAERLAKMCLFSNVAQDSEVRMEALRLAEFAMEHAERAIAARQVTPWLLGFIQEAKGISAYRHGDYESAVRLFQQSIPAMDKAPKEEWVRACQATDCLFLAMAMHQLKKPAESRQWLAEANQRMESLPKADGNRFESANDWLVMEIVRREAAGRMEGQRAEPKK